MLGANHIPTGEEEEAGGGNATLLPANDTAISVTSLPVQNQTLDASDDDDDEFVCAFYNPDFIIWSSIGSFYIPCCVMIYLYTRIFMVRELRRYILPLLDLAKD